MKTSEATRCVRAALTPDLLRRDWAARRPQGATSSWGLCYVACEAVRFLAEEELHPRTVRVDEGVHWFLVTDSGEVVDPTADQFRTPPRYEDGRGRGFLTKEPSKRTRVLLGRIT